MDWLTALICLAIGGTLPVVGVGLVLRRASRQLSTAGAYREVARTLGLVVDTRGISVHGVRDGRHLWIGEVLVGVGAERHTEVHAVIGLRQPLGLGIVVEPRRSRRDEGVALGHPELDKRLVAHAAWPEGLRAALHGGMREVLVGLVEHTRRVVLTDERLRLRIRRPPSTVAELGALVERMEQAAAALERARLAAPPTPAARDWPWADAVAVGDLDLDPTWPGVTGRLGGWPAVAMPTWVDGTWRAWIAVQFDAAEDTGLRVRPHHRAEGDPREGQDIVVGDAPFDAAFVVKGYDPEAVRTRLSAPVREALMHLMRLGQPQVDDHRIVVDRLDPRRLPEALRQVDTLAAELGPDLAPPAWLDVEP